MMMIGEESHRPNPTVQVPPWTLFDESAAGVLYQQQPVSGVTGILNGGDYSPYLLNETLKRFLPSNDTFVEDGESDVSDFHVDVYSCDDFRMYEFKVRRCNRGRSHDWTECPFAHPGEKARRRDPRKYHYSGTACPDFRKGSCKRGDSCEFAHGVFECWLHPARYRTQVCKDGTSCRRRVCFFAHTAEQLRVLPQQSPKVAGISQFSTESYDGSPLRQALDANPFYPKSSMLSSPTSTLLSPPLSPPSDSPPHSPLRRSFPSNSVNEVLLSLRQLQLSKAKSSPSWGVNCGFASPKGINVSNPFSSVPSTPTANSGWLDRWDRGFNEEEPMERVESGRDLRNKIFQKLSKENSVDVAASVAPDVGWVSELVK